MNSQFEKHLETKLAKPNETIRYHTDNLKKQAKLMYDNEMIRDEKLFKDILTACEYHDYGKLNNEFQARIKSKRRFNSDKEIPHNVLSTLYINKKECENYLAVFFAVLYHHYRKSSSPRNIFMEKEEELIKFSEEVFGSDDIYYDTEEAITDITEIFDIDEDTPEKKYAILLKGFLHKCDYSASAGMQCEIPNNFLTDCLLEWEKSVNSLRDLQNFCKENSDSNIVVTAPTGMGKTEAGLLWCGDNKCFFVLPLKTAINAMYERLKENIAGKKYKERLAIIHSDMNMQYFKICAVNENGEYDFEYEEKSRKMSLPITICTPDQIFDFVMKYPGYEYKLATASYSKFIIDEIQAYSYDLLAIIMYAIKRIYSVGGKFAVLTATLAPFIKQELFNITNGDIKTADFSYDGILRHNVKVYDKELNSEDVYNTINNIVSDDVKKFLIVCNSIDTATRIYDELVEMFDGSVKINLFHSGFTKKDRSKKEEEILNTTNKKRNDNVEIWISTSVVEASLDIDFDILFTELLDIMSLFQRLGRVNRKGIKSYEKTNCFIYTELQGNAKRYHFVDKDIYELSKMATLQMNGIITETDKSNLIKKYMSVDNIVNTDYYKGYKDTTKYLESAREYENNKEESIKKMRKINKEDIIPISVYDENKEVIDNAIIRFGEKNLSKEDRLQLYKEILDYTVSVSSYSVREGKNKKFIRVGYLNIPVLSNCGYSYEKGISIVKTNDDITDFFI